MLIEFLFGLLFFKSSPSGYLNWLSGTLPSSPEKEFHTTVTNPREIEPFQQPFFLGHHLILRNQMASNRLLKRLLWVYSIFMLYFPNPWEFGYLCSSRCLVYCDNTLCDITPSAIPSWSRHS